jgi:hypothetical protein
MKYKNISDHKKRAIKFGIHADKAQRLAINTENAIENYRLNKVRGAYNLKGNLVASILCGQFVRKDKLQNRIVTKSFPYAGCGRPRNDAVRVLVSFVAAAFTQAGGRVTLNREEMKSSAFQAYLEPILKKP